MISLCVRVFRYADGECSVTIKETVMGKDVFVVSPTHSNDSLIEMLLLIAAARRWGEKTLSSSSNVQQQQQCNTYQ